MSIKELLYYWSASYYTFPLATLAAFIGFIIFLLKRKTKAHTQLFLYYFAGYVALNLIYTASALLVTNSSRHTFLKIDRFSEFTFTLFEFLVFFVFFKRTLSVNAYRKSLAIAGLLFFSVSFSLLIYQIIYFDTAQLWCVHLLFNLQALSLLLLSIFYYLEIFKRKQSLELLKEPSFWVVTGLSFVLICTFPLSLCINYLYKSDRANYHALYSLFYISYFMLFLMIIQGHLCKPTSK